MKTFWLIAATASGLVALFFAYKGDFEKAFVAAAIGAVAWVLNYRVQLRQKLEPDKGTDETENDTYDE